MTGRYFARCSAGSIQRMAKWLLACSWVLAMPAWATNCGWIATNSTAHQETLMVDISNNGIPIQLGADAVPKYGSFAQFMTDTSFVSSVLTCYSGTNYVYNKFLVNSLPAATATDGVTVYQTPTVPAVGVRILAAGGYVPGQNPLVITNGASYAFNGTGYNVTYEFHRIAGQRITTGVVNGSDLPQVAVYFGDILVYTAQAIGQLKIVGLTCSVSPVSVDLGTGRYSQFKGVGQPISTPAVPFVITASNCPMGMNSVKVSLAATTSWSSNGVVGLSAGSTASGVGIQILDNTGSPVYFASNSYTLPYSSATGGTITQAFSARYFQTGTLKGGTANTQLLYTMTYL